MNTCDVVIPCRNEAAALPIVLANIPNGWNVIVVDNGSTDDTVAVARLYGATVVTEEQVGYGAAVHTGVLAATSDYIAIIDGDASMQLRELAPMLDSVRSGKATMGVGRRRPVNRGVWPWHARLGTLFLAAMIRRSSNFPIHDLAPMRVSRRVDLLNLEVQDRRFGYPLELMLKAARSGWVIQEFDVSYDRRAKGTKSKVSGSITGTLKVMHDFLKVLKDHNK